jgi:hypothetical protein
MTADTPSSKEAMKGWRTPGSRGAEAVASTEETGVEEEEEEVEEVVEAASAAG